MKYLLYALTIIVLAGLNIGLFPFIRIMGAAPSLLLVFLTISALEKDSLDFIFIAFCGGLIADAYSGAYFGAYTLAFLLLSLLLYLTVQRLFAVNMNWKYLVVTMAIVTIFVNCAVWLYSVLVYKAGLAPLAIEWHLVRKLILPESAYNILMLYPIYILSVFLRNTIADLAMKKHYLR